MSIKKKKNDNYSGKTIIDIFSNHTNEFGHTITLLLRSFLVKQTKSKNKKPSHPELNLYSKEEICISRSQ